MKTHLKALAITVGVLAILVGLYYVVAASKAEITPVTKVAEKKLGLPEGSLTLLDGKLIDLKSFAGKVIIFNFWASWCAPCIEEVPSLSISRESGCRYCDHCRFRRPKQR
jgi:thiol-disulfide isomerase/thioredoxin